MFLCFFGTIVSPKRNWKQCLCKILEGKQRVLWYFWKWPINLYFSPFFHILKVSIKLVKLIPLIQKLINIDNSQILLYWFLIISDKINRFLSILSSIIDYLFYWLVTPNYKVQFLRIQTMSGFALFACSELLVTVSDAILAGRKNGWNFEHLYGIPMSTFIKL